MNAYIVGAKKETELKIVDLIRELETINRIEVSAITFTRQSMCDKSGQKIKTWGVELSCNSSI